MNKEEKNELEWNKKDLTSIREKVYWSLQSTVDSRREIQSIFLLIRKTKTM